MKRRVFLMTAAGGWPAMAAPDVNPSPYGAELNIVANLGIGMTAAAAVNGNTLYAVGGGALGSLFVADISSPGAPKVIAKLSGLGHVRQMEVRHGIAYVTCREDGLFLIDVRRPERPEILSHYDTIELATGLALSGNVAFVACRQCGVEQIDISDPKRPTHLSTVRVGEAQSVAARDGYMYAGVWATRELVVCDIRDPRHPRQVASAGLDGYGDGVTLRGSLCYVATGHHSSGSGAQRPKPGEPGYGTGHGLEIFDISRPEHPRFVSRIKAPARYRVFMDMWSVQVAGRYAFLADTYNGIFVADVADPERPRFVAHRQLPVAPARGEGYVLLPGETIPSPVCGFALAKDHIYAAGGYSDLHVLAAPGLAAPVSPEPDNPPAIPAARPPAPDSRFQTYHPGGQIHEVIRWGSDADGAPRFLMACGSAGLHVARYQEGMKSLANHRVEDIAFGVAAGGGKVLVAEGMGGVSIWQGNERLKLVGRYRTPGESVKQVVTDPAGRYALLHVGLHRLEILDISNPREPRRVLDEGHFGLFYRRPISQALRAGQALVVWSEGLYQYDVSSATAPSAASYRYPFGIGARNGATPFGSSWLVTYASKYFILKPGDDRPPQAIGLVGPEGCDLSGKPTLFGSTLFVGDAIGGRAVAVDVSDVARPKLLGEMELLEHPGHIIEHDGVAMVPGGYQGLLLWRYGRAARSSVAADKP